MFHAQAQYAIKYFAKARVPWDGLGGVPYGPVHVSDGEKDGWTLGSTISDDAPVAPTTPPASECIPCAKTAFTSAQEDAHKFFGTSPEPSEEIMADCAEPETAKAEFPLAESGMIESPEPEAEIEVESPQCVEESVSETPGTEAVAGAAYESPDDEAESAAELSKATPAAPDQAVIDCTQEAPEVCFGFLALAHMHSRSGGPHETKMSSAVCIWHVGLEWLDVTSACKLVFTHPLQNCYCKTVTARPSTRCTST
jgi:hypothetical protein